MNEELTPLELVSKITEFNEIRALMQDDDIDEAMKSVIKIILEPSIGMGKAPIAINKLEALAAKFSIQASYYKYIGRQKAGTPEANKKAIYIEVAEDLRRLVDALKYTAKTGF